MLVLFLYEYLNGYNWLPEHRKLPQNGWFNVIHKFTATENPILINSVLLFERINNKTNMKTCST